MPSEKPNAFSPTVRTTSAVLARIDWSARSAVSAAAVCAGVGGSTHCERVPLSRACIAAANASKRSLARRGECEHTKMTA
jgi:hypothetical protein